MNRMPATALEQSEPGGSGGPTGLPDQKLASVRPLRILHVMDSGGLYGAERVLLNLGAECRKLGHEVCIGTIVAPRDHEDALGEAAKAAGLDHVQFRMRDGPNLRGLQQIFRCARAQRVDIIHSHGYKANILLALTPRRLRPCPMVCTMHGWTASGKLSRLALYEWLDRRLVGAFDRVVVVSRKIEELLSRLDDRVVLVPNGVTVDHDFKPDEAKARRTTQDGVTRILAAGRLSPEKGFDALIHAIEVLRTRGVAARLTIAGEGPIRAQLEAQVHKASLGGEVWFAGYVRNMDHLFIESDLFVLSSRSEGLPLVLLEAMSRGLPVIATAVGQVPEVLGQGEFGRLINSADPETLADAIQAQAHESRERTTAIVERAARHVNHVYSAERMAAAYCRIYLYCAHER